MNIERPEELRDYLVATGRVASDVPLQSEVLAGGVSCRTVLVRWPDGPSWVLKQSLPKLRVAMDWFSDPRRIHREALGLRHLQDLLPSRSVPEFLFEDLDCHLLAMGAVPEPHENWKSMLLKGRLEADHLRQFAGLLSSLHRNGWLKREQLAEPFADWSYFESLRLEPYYECSAEQTTAARPLLGELIQQTRQRRRTLVHGDFSPKNILVHSGRLVLLDHEVIHFGDPAFDLGFALTHLLSKGHYLREWRDEFRKAASVFWEHYESGLGNVPWRVDLEGFVVRHALGCLLARAVGRSPLEYLSDEDRRRQRQAAIDLMADLPTTVDGLCSAFLKRLESICP
jgi:5-methylthioribose kinase